MKFRVQCCFASGHIIYESKTKGNKIRISYVVYRMSQPSARRNLTSIHYIQRLSEQNVTYNSGKNIKKRIYSFFMALGALRGMALGALRGE